MELEELETPLHAVDLQPECILGETVDTPPVGK